MFDKYLIKLQHSSGSVIFYVHCEYTGIKQEDFKQNNIGINPISNNIGINPISHTWSFIDQRYLKLSGGHNIDPTQPTIL